MMHLNPASPTHIAPLATRRHELPSFVKREMEDELVDIDGNTPSASLQPPSADDDEDAMSVAQEELKAVPPQYLERCSSPSSADVLVGAYLLDHMRMHCEQCGVSDTPQWYALDSQHPRAVYSDSSLLRRRKGWDSPLTNKPVPLCNACGLKFAKKQSCPYCNYIYRREEERWRVNEWVGCALCPRYVHIACEAKSDAPMATKGVVFLCPECRILQPQLANIGTGPAFAS